MSGRKLKYCDVKRFFETRECVLLEKEYVNCQTEMRYLCRCGRESKTTWNRFKHQASLCLDCGREKQSKNVTVPFSTIKQRVEKSKKYIVLPIERPYTGRRTKFTVQCIECGNRYQMHYDRFCEWAGCKHRKDGMNVPCQNSHYRWISDRQLANNMKLFTKKCHSLLRNTLKASKQKKHSGTYQELGYGPSELIEHIKTLPNYNLLKGYKWHIDHIFPIKAFIDHNILDPSIINSLDNLCIRSPKDNCSKGARYDVSEFKKWIQSKGIIV